MTTATTRVNPLEVVFPILKKYWGFEALRPTQQDVIEAALRCRDAVVVMPTGGGKSLCFQVPPLVERNTTVVVSPLIALMKDQVDALRVRGVSAAALNSSMSPTEEEEARADLMSGALRVLYVSPERLLLPSSLSLFKEAKITRFAIDEAHCISEWGHDFRPEYRRLSKIKEEFPDAGVMAFTATATPKVQKDIAIQLRLCKPRLFVGKFDRPNLTYRIVAKDDPIKRIAEAVHRYPDEGIIVYCLSRANTETIAEALVRQGIPAVAYHAGLDNAARKRISEDFAQERTNVVVATIAFGMGIDRANVRCVIHDCLPKSMEGYQQETGRAGRDGLPSECMLLYNHGDIIRLKKLLEGGNPDYVKQQHRMLEEVRKYATGSECRHKLLSEYFGQAYDPGSDGCGACDVCLGGMRAMEGSTEIAHKLLEALVELRERFNPGFGVAYLVDVLHGSRKDLVQQRGGVNSTHWAAFKDQPKNRITSWIHQLMDQGLLGAEGDKYPILHITSEGQETLRNRAKVRILENEALLAPAKERRSRTEFTVDGMDEALFEQFRQWRRAVAEEKGVPPYVIFHDATLMRIAAVRPSTPKALNAIPGMGEQQMHNYGGELMKMVAQHCKATNATMDQALAQRAPQPNPGKPTAAQSAYAGLFRQGVPISEVAAMHGVRETTVWDRLSEWVGSGECASLDPWISASIQERVSVAVRTEESNLLKPIHEALGGEVEYGIIRTVKNWLGVPSQVQEDQVGSP